jgi:lipoprotein-anchoring transpeptidase ErfK/SrfK
MIPLAADGGRSREIYFQRTPARAARSVHFVSGMIAAPFQRAPTMKTRKTTILSCAVAAILAAASSSAVFAATAQSELSPELVNSAVADGVDANSHPAAILRAQVLLARAHYSPGEIDAASGSTTEKTIAAYQAAHGLDASGKIDAATWTKLNADTAPILDTYKIAAEDVAGPFQPIPSDMMAKSKMSSLGYTSAAEALGEKFHASPTLLRKLNPGKAFSAGEEIVVPNVTAAALPAAAKVVVDRSDSSVSLVDAAGATIARFPASTGSEHDPLPTGDWKIQGISRNPTFHYNPALFWDANPKHSKAEIPAGPNNPVGVVWVDLSKEHYGIHGTPEPSKIGKTESHGCIRLTNWDALIFADAVSAGMPALLQE